jgi:hypothetical protein
MSRRTRPYPTRPEPGQPEPEQVVWAASLGEARKRHLSRWADPHHAAAIAGLMPTHLDISLPWLRHACFRMGLREAILVACRLGCISENQAADCEIAIDEVDSDSWIRGQRLSPIAESNHAAAIASMMPKHFDLTPPSLRRASFRMRIRAAIHVAAQLHHIDEMEAADCELALDKGAGDSWTV